MAAASYTIAVAVADPPIARFIALALRLASYQAQVFADGEEAITSMLREPVDAAVLDARLARVDGFTICERVRAVSRMPIVLLLWREEAHQQVRALQVGATTCLLLPIGVEELLGSLRVLLPQAKLVI